MQQANMTSSNGSSPSGIMAMGQPVPLQDNPAAMGNCQPLTIEQNLERLLSLSVIEMKDDYEEKMCRYYLMVQNLIAGKSEHQIHEELTRMCRENNTLSDEITFGLIVSMLLDFHNCHRLFIPIILSNRDGGTQLCNYLNQILTEKYLRLHDHARQRLLLLCKELLRSGNFQNIETIYYNLMRNIVSGDTSSRNLALAESVIDILIEYRFSYDNNIPLIQYALFKYLRLIADHINPGHQRLLLKEVKYCHCLLMERFVDFLPIGRDLIRLLQQICRVPEFDQLWKTMLINPTSLTPRFNLVHVMKTRTPRRFIRLLITFDIEKKLNFLVSQVRLGFQRRYQDWFQRQYLNCPENQMLRTDLIRFICNSIHPSNEVIASDLVPRWAVIGWILNSCPHQVTMCWSRLALFYDWLMFDIQDTNNNLIMDLEPGLLVMYFSLKNYTGITTALLDFLCRISTEFYPPLTNQIKQGIRNALIHQLEKRVIPNIQFMFDPTKIDQQLRQFISKTFPELQTLIDTPHPIVTPGTISIPGQPTGASPYQQSNTQPSQGGIVVPNGHYFTTTQIPSSTITATSCSSAIVTSNIINPTTVPTTNCQLSSTSQSTNTYYSASSSFSSAASCSASPLELSLFHNTTSSTSVSTTTTTMISSSSSSGPMTTTPVRLLSSSVVVVSASHAAASMTHSLLTPNTNPILTNIKPINVVKQISSASPLSLSSSSSSSNHHQQTMIGTESSSGLHNQSNVIYSQSQPSMMVNSKFSDDEEDDNANNSSNLSKLKPPAVKKMKKSNSFSSGSSPTRSNTKLPNTKPSNNNSSTNTTTNTISPVISSNINPSIQQPTATTTIQNPNAKEYIANILNSTVMNNNNNNNQASGNHFQMNNNNSVSVIMSSTMQSNSNSKEYNSIDSSMLNSLTSGAIKPEIVTIIEEGNDDNLISSNSPLDSSLPFTSYSSHSISHHMLDHHSMLVNQSTIDSGSICQRSGPALTQEELSEQIEQITNESIRSLVLRLSEDRNQQSQCETMEQLVNQLLEYQDEEGDPADFIPNLTMVLSAILDEDMCQKRFLNLHSQLYSNWLQPDHRLLKSSIDGPVFVMFRALVNVKQPVSTLSTSTFDEKDDKSSDNEKDPTIFKTLLAELATNNARIGFLLLYYLVVTENTFDRMVVYRDLVRFMGKDLSTTVLSDLETCICHDYFIFFYLIPDVMKAFPSFLIGNFEMLSLILDYADYQAIQYLVILIQRDQLRLFKKESLLSIIASSSKFDHLQQHLLWDILDAHDFPLETYLSILTKLEDNENNTAVLNHLINMFKREEPSNQFLKLLMNRDHHKLGDCFVVNVLMYWAKKYEEKLADVIAKYVSSIISSPNKRNKRTLNNVSKNQMNKTANVEQLLYYLDEMRKGLSNNKDNNFFSQEFLNVILIQLKQICSGPQKIKYCELFANVPDDNDNSNSKNIAGASGNTQKKNLPLSGSSNANTGNKKNQNKKQNMNFNSNNSATESDSSEEDVPQRTSKSNLRNKKRKQPVGFDSD